MSHQLTAKATTAHHAAPIVADRPRDPAVRLHGPGRHIAARTTTAPPGVVPVAAVAVGYVALVVVLATIGWAITHSDLLSGLRAWDDGVVRWFSEHRTSALDSITGILSRGADTMGVVAFAAVVEIVLLVQRRWWALIIVPFALGLELATFLTVNALVDRPRPDVVRLGSEPSTSSFPSGHTAATVALWGGVALLFCWHTRRRSVRLVAAAVVVLLATAVGASRMYRGMHHPTDVAVGALMGLATPTIIVLAVRLLVAEVEERRARSHQDETTPDERMSAVAS